MQISDIESNQKNVNILAQVAEISPVKEFSKFGRIGRVASAVLKDTSGEIQLILWDEQIELVKEGDKLNIQNAFVKEWQGTKQLNLGRYGNLEIVN